MTLLDSDIQFLDYFIVQWERIGNLCPVDRWQFWPNGFGRAGPDVDRWGSFRVCPNKIKNKYGKSSYRGELI